jgi:tRNA-dihydrouridine synthase
MNNLPKPFMVLAPMDDVTDVVFRRLVKSCAPADLYFTEFVNVDGLSSPGRPKLLKKLKFVDEEDHLIAQLWGKEPTNFYNVAKQIADGQVTKEVGASEGHNFVGVDLNMGCPQKNEVGSGTCAALINNRELAKEIIDQTRKGLDGKLPLSVKTRIGYNEVDLTWIEFLLKQNLNMLAVHGRTKKEKSAVPAHWDLINEARKLRDKISPKTLIVGNGDVKNKEHALELANKYKLDGIMIGRGIFNDPFAFSEKDEWTDFNKEQRIELYKKHLKLFQNAWQNNERPIHTINKFCKVYISGFDGAKELREKLMMVKNIEDAFTILDNQTATSSSRGPV